MNDEEPNNSFDPGVETVYKYIMYSLSVPERTVRSTAAMVGGAISESASLLVPRAFQDSKTYQTFVKQMLDMVNNDIGGVQKNDAGSEAEQAEQQAQEVENYVAKKTVSSFIDLAGMATLHVSPLTILALVSDIAYGSNVYLKELAFELEQQGVIEKDSSINNAADLLAAIGNASGKSADQFDTPPLSIEGLQQTIEEVTGSLADIDPTLIIPQSELQQLWIDMGEIAGKQDVDLFEVSSAMTMYAMDQVTTVSKGALTTIRVTGELMDRHLFDHYRQGLDKINDEGIYQMVSTTAQPYIDAVWQNFSSDKATITEELVSGRMVKKAWDGFFNWLGGEDDEVEKE
jgi:hypothetical protein